MNAGTGFPKYQIEKLPGDIKILKPSFQLFVYGQT
jgi:hypothetical protein